MHLLSGCLREIDHVPVYDVLTLLNTHVINLFEHLGKLEEPCNLVKCGLSRKQRDN